MADEGMAGDRTAPQPGAGAEAGGGQGARTKILDVRDDLRAGRKPLRRILDAVGGLAADQDLLLYATFEPVPLYALLRLRGFGHTARRLPGGGWEVHFTRPARGQGKQPPAPATARPAGTQPGTDAGPEPADWLQLDNRGLAPPEPMMRTLEALDALKPGQGLEIHNDRRPAFLYPHLEERGLRHQTRDEADGSARVRIWR